MRNKERDGDYFALFLSQAKCACDASETVYELIHDFDSFDIPETLKKVHEAEHRGDLIKKKITEKLSGEFLPPIEREDIMAVANELDNVTDAVEDILRHIYMYNVISVRREACEFINVVRKSCVAVYKMTEEFANYKKSEKLKRYISEINELEEEGDAVYERAVRELFSSECDPKTLLSWNEIFSEFEECCDVCEHAADAVETVVLKNS